MQAFSSCSEFLEDLGKKQTTTVSSDIYNPLYTTYDIGMAI
jgi:hypothetical protein